MSTNKPGHSDKITAQQIDETIEIVKQIMLISLDTTKIILYGKYGINLKEMESKKLDAMKSSK